jgi:copper chaperone CopZ
MKNLFIGLVMALISISYSSAQSTAHEKVEVKKPVSFQWIELKVMGMTCAGCASHIHKALSDMKGVLDQEVKYPGDLVRVKFDPLLIREPEIQRAIAALGYKVIETKPSSK